MEQHDGDPTTDGADPWADAGEHWSTLRDKLRSRYREIAGEDGPSEEDIRGALGTLGEAGRAMVDSFGAAMKDPTVRAQVTDAAASLVSAMGQTFSQLGDEIRKPSEEEPTDD